MKSQWRCGEKKTMLFGFVQITLLRGNNILMEYFG